MSKAVRFEDLGPAYRQAAMSFKLGRLKGVGSDLPSAYIAVALANSFDITPEQGLQLAKSCVASSVVIMNRVREQQAVMNGEDMDAFSELVRASNATMQPLIDDPPILTCFATPNRG